MADADTAAVVGIYTALNEKITKDMAEIAQDGNTESILDKDLLKHYNKMIRYSNEVDKIRHTTYSEKQMTTLNDSLHITSRDLQNIILQIEVRIDRLYKRKVQNDLKEKKLIERSQASENGDDLVEDISNSGKRFGDYSATEDIDTLRSRLLNTNYNQLDEIETTEVQNNYHNSIQQELIDSLPSMVTSLKEQALQFQGLIKQDANVLREATQNFEASHGKFDNVNALLSKYHKEGRLGFWFYIRVIAMILVSFLFMLIIIRLIPARH